MLVNVDFDDVLPAGGDDARGPVSMEGGAWVRVPENFEKFPAFNVLTHLSGILIPADGDVEDSAADRGTRETSPGFSWIFKVSLST